MPEVSAGAAGKAKRDAAKQIEGNLEEVIRQQVATGREIRRRAEAA